jgi:hypothetical protein
MLSKMSQTEKDKQNKYLVCLSHMWNVDLLEYKKVGGGRLIGNGN